MQVLDKVLLQMLEQLFIVK